MHLRIAIICTLFIWPLWATPTSLFWTFCTTDVVPAGTVNVAFTDYFKVGSRAHPLSFSPVDIGFQLGALAYKDIQAEAGVDYITGRGSNQLFFNAKIGMQEGALFTHAPSLSIGMFNIGVSIRGSNRTHQNIADVVMGKYLPDWIGGKIFVGAFSGSHAMGKNRQGFMIGFTRNFLQVKDSDGKDYYKWNFGIDYASGKNTIGGAGCGITYYFTPSISIQTGPVWFNSKKINGKWNWSVQLTVNNPVIGH